MEKLYARIHPDACSGSTPVRLYDVAGTQFVRGGGAYKGWYEVTSDQADRLRKCHVQNGNPNSMRVFQIEHQKTVDEISSTEARSRMAPEQQRIDVARDREIAKLQQQLGAVQPLLQLFGGAEGMQRLARLIALDKASSGEVLTADENDHVARVAEAPPRRPPMTERDIEDPDTNKRTQAALPAQPPTRTDNRPAPAPPARPGARPGAGARDKKDDAKDAKKDPKKDDGKQAGVSSAASLPSPLSSDAHVAADPSLLDDEDDDSDV